MESRHVEAFLVLAKELHFGNAAKKMQITQPILSQLIKAFETDLGIDLFVRTTRSVALSPAGQALIAPARGFMDKASEIRKVAAAAQQGRIGRVKVGFSGGAGYSLVFQLAKLTAENAHNVLIDIQPQTFSAPAIEQLRDGTLDLAVLTVADMPDDLEVFLVRRDHLVVAVSDLHPFATKSALTIEDLRSERIISFPEAAGSQFRKILTDLAHEAGFEPSIVQEVHDPYSLVTMVGANVGLALLGESAQQLQSPGVQYIPLEGVDEEVLIHLAWKRDQLSASLRLVLQLAASHLGADLPESVAKAEITK